MNARPAKDDTRLVETFAAELTVAVYSVALRHGPAEKWLELELGLWKAIAHSLDRWQPAFSVAPTQRYGDPDPS